MLKIDSKKYPRSSELDNHYSKRGHNYEIKREWILINKEGIAYDYDFSSLYDCYDIYDYWNGFFAYEETYSEDQIEKYIDENVMPVLKKEYEGSLDDSDRIEMIYDMVDNIH